MNQEKEDFIFEILELLAKHARTKLNENGFNDIGLNSESCKKVDSFTIELLNGIYDDEADLHLEQARLCNIKNRILFLLQSETGLSEETAELFRNISFKLMKSADEHDRKYKQMVNQRFK